MHNVGDYDTEQAIGKNGCLDGLREARKRGLIRFIGCTGHLRPQRFIPVLETGRDRRPDVRDELRRSLHLRL